MASIIAGSAIVAVQYDGAWREMAAGAFSGGFIGGLLVLYEQSREERRHSYDATRDDRMNRATNLSRYVDELARLVSFEFGPALNDHLDRLPARYVKRQHLPFWVDEVEQLRSQLTFLVERVRDQSAITAYAALLDEVKQLNEALNDPAVPRGGEREAIVDNLDRLKKVRKSLSELETQVVALLDADLGRSLAYST